MLSQVVMLDLSPRAGETILDLGCGDGKLAAAMQKLGCEVVGVDSSPSLTAAARARGVDARLGNAEEIDFDESFDAVFSNAAIHWMPRHEELSRRVHRALKPGGRFVAELGGRGNIACIIAAMEEALAELGFRFDERNPWTFPSAEGFRELLELAGFRVEKCALRPRPTTLPTDARGWFDTFCGGILSDIPPETRPALISRMVELCRPHLCSREGTWIVDYVRLNFVAVKP